MARGRPNYILSPMIVVRQRLSYESAIPFIRRLGMFRRFTGCLTVACTTIVFSLWWLAVVGRAQADSSFRGPKCRKIPRYLEDMIRAAQQSFGPFWDCTVYPMVQVSADWSHPRSAARTSRLMYCNALN